MPQGRLLWIDVTLTHCLYNGYKDVESSSIIPLHNCLPFRPLSAMNRRLPPELIREIARHSLPREQALLSRASQSCWFATGLFIWREVIGIENIVQLLTAKDIPFVEDNSPRQLIGPNIVRR
jgi:hypothetical protein